MEMELLNLFRNLSGKPAQEKLIIVGVNPIIQEITENPLMFYDILRSCEKLNITLIYENETENFNQSLFYTKGISKNKMDFDKLQTYRSRLIGGKKGRKNTAGFVEDILKYCDDKEIQADMRKRIKLLQNNLRSFVNLIMADDVIWYCFTTLDLPQLSMYRKVTENSDEELYKQLENYVNFLMDEKTGGKYMSKPDDELIELYDMRDMPRGIYPRKAFYTTNFQRYSVWAFIFNRKGELLLQQRSPYTADNRELWDKSAGGHVDLKDSSTIITAKRELVEELFLPEAEFSKYMSAELGDIVDFGEWNIEKRPEKNFRNEFDGLAPADWIVFRATTKDGDPMTVQRKSPRIMHVKDKDKNGNLITLKDKDGKEILGKNGKQVYQEHKEIWYTRFISDVFLFIAPEGYIDSQEEIEELMGIAEEKGAQCAHRLTTIEELIEDVEANPDKYTDDMVYMCSEEKWLLVEFAESIKYIFR